MQHLLDGELFVRLDLDLACLFQGLLLDEGHLIRSALSHVSLTYRRTNHLVHLAQHFFIVERSRSHDAIRV